MKKLLLIFLLILFSACSVFDTGAYKVEYVVSGNGTASITYETSEGCTGQISEISLPWRYEFDCYVGVFLYVSAQIMTGNNVTVQIIIDDSVWKNATGTGLYSIATAYGTTE